MAPTATVLKPPPHLSAPSREWWSNCVSTYEMRDDQLMLLTLAGEAWDRTRQAREILAQDGPVFKDDRGNLRPHPAISIERNSQITFARLCRQLGFEDDAVRRGPGRPPFPIGAVLTRGNGR